jgi:hypothetical protein
MAGVGACYSGEWIEIAMRRDELLDRLHALPTGADVGVKIGDGHLDISDVVAWGSDAFGALTCRPEDV